MLAIETQKLTKTFGRGAQAVQALKNVDLAVPAGQVFGFLGPNGAGKTTTVRVLMGLVRPTAGRASIFGRDVQAERQVLESVGAMVESPAFYGYLSGRDNLAVLARTAGVYDPLRIGELLARVGLGENGNRPVKGYSMGMKQRLGIAAALLGDPDLVLLDEPTNGLDPAGIREMRDFIRGLAENQHKTVFVCSHLLHEVEQVCDQVAIIDHGEIVRQGTVLDLLAAGRTEMRLLVTPQERAITLLQAELPVSTDGDWLTATVSPQRVPVLIRRLVEGGVDVHQVVQKQQSLEEYFIAVTRQEDGDA